MPPQFGKAPDPPACPPGVILWAPVAWYPDRLVLHRTDASDPSKKRQTEEGKIADAWKHGQELVHLFAKLRPALVVSSEQEHQLRKSVRLLPLYRASEDDFYLKNESKIRLGHVPGLIWIDGLSVDGVVEPRIIDCTRAVRFPFSLIQGRERIASMDGASVLSIKTFWSKSVLT